MNLPRELDQRLAGRALEPINVGESGAAVWRCTKSGEADWYLKASRISAQLGLEREAACMRWIREAGLPAPAVLDYYRGVDMEFLLSEAAVGAPASDGRWNDSSAQVAIALGTGLARLHSTEVSTCPFDRRIAVQLNEARARIASGEVREDDFDEARLGRDANELFAELLTMVPPQEDLVLVHGDFCLPNVLLTQDGDALHMTGIIDCGRAGIGDRHQDIALAIRSLRYNFGPETVRPFLSAYSGPATDARTLEFFTVLDEFF